MLTCSVCHRPIVETKGSVFVWVDRHDARHLVCVERMRAESLFKPLHVEYRKEARP